MKKFLMFNYKLVLLIFIFSNIESPAQEDFLWVKRVGGTTGEWSQSISADSKRNLYISGNFHGTLPLGSVVLTSVGSNDIFLAKYDEDGNFIWGKRAGGLGSDQGWNVVADKNDNVYLSGVFEQTAYFDNYQLVSSGAKDIFIAKYDQNGNFLWAKSAGGVSDDYVIGMAVDSLNNLLITGSFYSTATFGTFQLTSSGVDDIFVAKYDSSGNCQWAKKAGGTNMEGGRAIALDASGSVYISGYFYLTASFGNFQITSAGGTDVFIAKLNSGGDFLWAKRAGGTGFDQGRDIIVSKDGGVYLTGSFSNSASFDNHHVISSGGKDIFIAKYDQSGNCLWSKSGGGRNEEDSWGVTSDEGSNSYIIGSFKDTVYFNNNQMISLGEEDIFVAKYDGVGNCIWVKSAGGVSSDRGNKLTIDKKNNIYLTGVFSDTAFFGSGQITSIGSSDIFISKIGLTSDEVRYDRIEFYQSVEPNPTNPNNYLNSGKRVRFKIRIQNTLPVNILTGYGIISSSNPKVKVIDSLATFNNVLAGDKGWSVDEFEIEILNSFEPDSLIILFLTVTQAITPSGPWGSYFSFPIEPLKINNIILDDDQFPDSWGNNNKIPESDETVETLPLINNNSPISIFFVEGKLFSNIQEIEVWNNVNGASGLVYDTWRYNVSSGMPQPITVGAFNILPELDYVFKSGNISSYSQLPFSFIYTGYLLSNPSQNWDEGGIKIIWEENFNMINGVVSLEHEHTKTNYYQLFQNYPNPFNPTTSIKYSVPKQSNVSIKLYDVLGNEISTLVNEEKGMGNYTVKFNSGNLSSGIYFYQMKTETYTQTKKMLLLR